MLSLTVLSDMVLLLEYSMDIPDLEFSDAELSEMELPFDVLKEMPLPPLLTMLLRSIRQFPEPSRMIPPGHCS